jgi:hypothetical protein
MVGTCSIPVNSMATLEGKYTGGGDHVRLSVSTNTFDGFYESQYSRYLLKIVEQA